MNLFGRTRRILIPTALMAAAALTVAACSSSSSATAASSSGQGGSAHYTIAFAGVNTANSTQGEAQAKFSQLIEASSGGRIQVHNTYNSALGSTNTILQDVSTGSLQMSAASPSDLSAFCPSLNILSLPFLFTSLADARKAIAGQGGQDLFNKCNGPSMQYYAVQEYGMDAILSTSPLSSVSQFSGLKIRTIPGDVAAQALTVVGASPESLSFSEVPTALTTNEINATVNSIQNTYSSGLYKLAKYLTTSDFLYSPSVVVINTKFLNSLPADLKADVITAIKQAGAYQIQLNGPATTQDLTKMEAAGVKVTTMSAAQEQLWKSKAQGLYTSTGQKYSTSALAALQQ